MKTYLWHYTSYEGFRGIITSKELWLRDTSNMNDKEDRTYGRECVTRAIQSCGENSIFYKYRNIDIEPALPLFHHYSMSFCKKENPYLLKKYANDEIALVFDIDKLQIAVYDVCGLSFTEILNFRDINYELNIPEIERTCNYLESRFLSTASEIHRQTELTLIKKLLYSVYSGYTKKKKYRNEKEQRLCYVDESSAFYKDAIPEILRLLEKDRKEEALVKLTLHQRVDDHYPLKLGSAFYITLYTICLCWV